jgi:hypothetical protein
MKKFNKHAAVALIVLASILVIIRLGYAGKDDAREGIARASHPVALAGDVFFPERLTLAGEEVPLWRQDVAEALRRELIVNAYLHAQTIQLLKNAPRCFARVVPVLVEEGVPEDFKYLAVAESALNPTAVSPAGAAGTWQFMKTTAREYGLEVTDEVDERYHLEKATRAACRYLKRARERFGSWALAAAAYNAGESSVARKVATQRETSYYDLLLAEETNRYLFRVLALKQILEHPTLYGFRVPEPHPAEEFVTRAITASIDSLHVFAQEHGVSYKILRRFNPWLRGMSLKVEEGKKYEIALPRNKRLYR